MPEHSASLPGIPHHGLCWVRLTLLSRGSGAPGLSRGEPPCRTTGSSKSLKANRPDLYRHLKANGQLEQHLDEVAQSAQTLRQQVRQQLEENRPYNPVEWRSREAWSGTLNRMAEELVLHDRVLVPDEETEKATRDGTWTSSVSAKA